MSRFVIHRLCITTCTFLLLAACAQVPERPAVLSEQQAQNQIESGHPQAAAAIYLKAAPHLPIPQRQRTLLKAAALLLQAKLPERARTVIEGISPKGLSPEDLTRKALLSARIAIFEHKPGVALAALPTNTSGLSSPLIAELLDVRAQAERLNGNLLGAISDRIARGTLLTHPDQQEANQLALWELLSQATPAQTMAWQQEASTQALQAWLALALLAKTTPPEVSALNQALAKWQQQYPNFPAATPIIKALRTQWQSLQIYPNQIAVLLPLSGRFAPVSRAILDGIMSAYYRHNAQQTQGQHIILRIYDTGKAPNQILALYERAISKGAQYVIGPLDRNAVTQIAQSGHVSEPTLALNYATSGTTIPDQLYQFGLLPENEATQVAERASLNGHKRAIILVPEDSWGKKIAQAFSTRFQQLGGQVLATGYFDPVASDFTPTLVNVLNIDDSDARRREVDAVIGRSVAFEARRRQDVDMIFAAGDPRQVRLLMPQIRFHHGIGLPVYSISAAYSGTHDPRADHDLDGLIFIDAPLLLDTQGPAAAARAAMHNHFPNSSRRYPRLIALGEDAFDVLPSLKRLGTEDWARFDGLSGILKMGPGNSLIRQLEGAQFTNGTPSLLGQTQAQATPPIPSGNSIADPTDGLH